MVRMRKITKKKLKEPDEFVSFTEQGFLFVSHHAKPIVVSGIIALILVLAVFYYQKWEKGKEAEANRKFDLAVYTYKMVSSPDREGSPSEYKNVLEQFGDIVAKFPKTSSGKMALLYEGDIHLRLSEFEEAIKSYQTFLEKAGKEKIYLLFAFEGLGYSFEGKKDYEEALQSYQKMIEGGESFKLEDAYLNVGRCYEKLGKNKEALESYKAFLKVSQKSMMANEVLRKISILEK